MAGDEGDTREVPLPPSETGPVPVSFEVARPRLFGVAPPLGIFALACIALTLALVALVSGRWILGLVAVAGSLLLLAFFLQLARKPSAGAFAGASTAFVDGVGARAGLFRTSLGAWSQARREVLRLKQELLRLGEEREAELRVLGEAALRKDAKEMGRIRKRIGELDGKVAERERAIAEAVEQARSTVGDERFAIQPTERVELPAASDRDEDPD